MSEKKYILALDQGTTSSRAILFDHGGSIIATAQQEFEQIFPRPGWVEHNATEIWDTQLAVLRGAIEKAGAEVSEVAALGITNQRETTVVWDRTSGRPIHHAIVWQDRRTAGYCDELRAQGAADKIRRKTGLVLDAYFSATKVKWLLDKVPGAREKAGHGELAFGTIDSWLVWNLTGGETHVTDVTNASRTMLYNIHSLEWDKELLELFDIPSSLLPDVRASSEVYANTNDDILGLPIPIAGIAGDQQSALFGQMCTESGMAKNTYGTGCFLMLNTGREVVASKNNLLSTIAWKLGDQVTYALEGSVFVAGAAIQWLRDGLQIIEQASDSEEMATSVEDNGGVYFVPALTGLGAPHWDAYARGTIVGITRGTSRAHITRAALEGICLQVKDVVKAMEADTGNAMKELRVDGGAVANNFLLQFQADVLRADVVRPTVLETTALGAAYLAGLAVGFWRGLDDVRAQWQMDRRFQAEMDGEKADLVIEEWTRAVGRAKQWAT